MDIVSHNRDAWDRESKEGGTWSTPVDADTIARARNDDWKVVLTPNLPVPRDWFPDLKGADVLGLASAGGQQVPIFAAAGANVVSFDNSQEQLQRDNDVAKREDLNIKLQQGDMRDLSCFDDASFDLIFHPVSNVFVPEIIPVWQEAFRVLRPGGRLLSGMMNPAFFLFDHDGIEAGKAGLELKYTLPFSDTEQLPTELLNIRIDKLQAMEFSHSLQDQIGGQIEAGFQIAGFYEDVWNSEATPLNDYFPIFFATHATKPAT